MPASVTRPSSGSRKRRRRFVTVVLPAPLGPTSAMRRPGASRRSKPLSAGGSPAHSERSRAREPRCRTRRRREWLDGIAAPRARGRSSSSRRRPAARVATAPSRLPGAEQRTRRTPARERKRRHEHAVERARGVGRDRDREDTCDRETGDRIERRSCQPAASASRRPRRASSASVTGSGPESPPRGRRRRARERRAAARRARR